MKAFFLPHQRRPSSSSKSKFMYVFMYVCMYVCIWIHTHVCMYTYIHTRVYTDTHTPEAAELLVEEQLDRGRAQRVAAGAAPYDTIHVTFLHTALQESLSLHTAAPYMLFFSILHSRKISHSALHSMNDLVTTVCYNTSCHVIAYGTVLYQVVLYYDI